MSKKPATMSHTPEQRLAYWQGRLLDKAYKDFERKRLKITRAYWASLQGEMKAKELEAKNKGEKLKEFDFDAYAVKWGYQVRVDQARKDAFDGAREKFGSFVENTKAKYQLEEV